MNREILLLVALDQKVLAEEYKGFAVTALGGGLEVKNSEHVLKVSPCVEGDSQLLGKGVTFALGIHVGHNIQL